MTKTSFQERMDALNTEQKEVVQHIFGPLMVVAGPGSGKTEVLSLRVAEILQKTDIGPGGILCLTFTDSARMNMRDRLTRLIGPEASRVHIHTFHSFATYLIGRFPEYFFGAAPLAPVEKAVSTDILSGILHTLPHNHPFASFHPEHGYVYMRDIIQSISHLKRAGISVSDFEKIITSNQEALVALAPYVDKLFSQRLSKKDLPQYTKTLEEMRVLVSKKQTPENILGVFKPLAHVLYTSLSLALQQSTETDSTTPLSEWKTEHTRLEGEKRVLKETVGEEKMFALLRVYEAYQKELYKRGYMDFDDMIISLIAVLEQQEHIRLTLQEELQFILVDEFQDTNAAQMRILKAITYDPAYNTEPNIMVVGDDDQSIYKFQGAELSNMFQFTKLFPQTKIVSLGKNYRSTKEIVQESRDLISLLSQSLESALGITKLASGERQEKSMVRHQVYSTAFDEYEGVAREIKAMLDTGVSPASIAVIGRYHSGLQELVPFLRAYDIPIAYEREQHVLQMQPIRELLSMLSYVALAMKEGKEADYLLCEMVSYPYWRIDRQVVWRIAEDAREKKTSWLACMRDVADANIQHLVSFLTEVSVMAVSSDVESIIDILVGTKSITLPTGPYTSPYKAYYFNDKTDGTYLAVLSGLRVFIHALREHYRGQYVKVEKIPQFIELYTQHKIELLDTTPFASGDHNVSLLSAHKAKGLEFDVVFVLSANTVWTERGAIAKISFPMNMPIAPDLDDRDDFIRILYVAMTRARHTLFLTSHRVDSHGKEKLPLPFFVDTEKEEIEFLKQEKQESLISVWSTLSAPPFVQSEKNYLTKQLDGYMMSVTHLNNFLDVCTAGPAVCLEKNILLFPEKKSLSAVYGTAIHTALAFVSHIFKKTGTLPPLAEVVSCMEQKLVSAGIAEHDVAFWFEKGKEVLTRYLQERKDSFSQDDVFEKSFNNEGVVLSSGAHITGNIDKLVRLGDRVVVTDFKTGRAKHAWEKMDPQLYNYKRQLLFYKLLIEKSRSFAGTTMNTGILEFLDPSETRFVDLSLDTTGEDMDRFEKLVSLVYQKIKNLDFPDTTKYSRDLAGCIAFEEDIVRGSI